MSKPFVSPNEPDEVDYAQGRRSDRTYFSQTFELGRPGSADDGSPARFIYKVLDGADQAEAEFDGETWLIRESPGGRVQVKLLIAREEGNVKDLWIHRVPTGGGDLTQLLHLSGAEALRLAELMQMVPRVPVEGGETVRIDDALLHEVLRDPETLDELYRRDPGHFRSLIAGDANAKDVVALAARRAAVDEFEALLADDEYFDRRSEERGSEEGVWQDFFEANPWMFGVTLTGQLLTAWDEERLERTVSGSAVGTRGKRVDALMRTSGRISSMVFAEIKTHRTPLLKSEYRSGCWSPDEELAGGVVQIQGTAELARQQMGDRLQVVAADGSEIVGDVGHLLRPRSFLVIGHLDQLVGEGGGVHEDRFRSFELFRRHLQEPEVITFDELLARARWVVECAERVEEG